MYYNSIKQFYSLLNKRPDINFITLEILNIRPGLPVFFIYTKGGLCSPESGLFKNSTFSIEQLLVSYHVIEIGAWILDEPNEPDEYYIYLRNYDILDIKADIIKRAWKKYRYNVFKKRRDPLKRELMEYYYHPSRLIF